MNKSGVFILCQIWIVIIICVMAIDWKNLIQIQVSEESGYSHDQSTMEVNKLDQYALNELHAIRELVKHDPKLQILLPSTCKCIRKLRIHRQRVRGKWAGRTRRLVVKQE